VSRKTRNASAVLKLEVASSQGVRIAGHRTGRVVEVRGGAAVVDYPGNPHGPLVARRLRTPTFSLHTGGEVLLVFENERSDRPIVVGLLAPSTTEAPEAPAIEVLVDGSRVVLEGKEEIVLRCGQASITLRKNGRVVVRGTHVETRSQGVNRIKGGTVQIN
jgi:hypothetical protein